MDETASYPSIELAGVNFENSAELGRVEVSFLVEIDGGTRDDLGVGVNSSRVRVYVKTGDDIHLMIAKARPPGAAVLGAARAGEAGLDRTRSGRESTKRKEQHEMTDTSPNVTGNEMKLFQREIKMILAAQERKLDAHYETLTGAISDLTESVRQMGKSEDHLERRLAAIENLLTARRTD
ncbi:MAG: hypothetical protein OXB98_03730 [Bryobacterales bacterium]|nr:hypothetical protein [Bryobacterales bacterium]